MIDIYDKLFNNDLDFGGIVIPDFTPKKEFEMQGLFKKMTKLLEGLATVGEEEIFDRIDFTLAEKVSKWIDDNTTTTEEVIKSGDILTKNIIFINMYLDYIDYKKKLKQS